MREILFRGKGNKRFNTGEWYEGLPIQDYGGDWQICDNLSKRVVIPSTIGQYTGLKDKNGMKIFEGDMLLFNKGRNLPNNIVVPDFVLFNQGNCAFERYPLGKCITRGGAGKLLQPDMMLECEVIGNIYDNPELLKECENNVF